MLDSSDVPDPLNGRHDVIFGNIEEIYDFHNTLVIWIFRYNLLIDWTWRNDNIDCIYLKSVTFFMLSFLLFYDFSFSIWVEYFYKHLKNTKRERKTLEIVFVTGYVICDFSSCFSINLDII